MKRLPVIAAMLAAGSLGAVGVANTSPERPMAPAFGDLTDTLALDDVWVDAERTFVKVDVNRDGRIDVNEYAAQAVAYASLVRFEGLIAVDGREAVHVGLPQVAEVTLGESERAAIDAVARADYYEIVAADGAITPRRWVGLRLDTFTQADRNEDGQLTGRELGEFAMAYARYDSERGWL